MNFQAVSVGQKLDREERAGRGHRAETGGYLDGEGRPTTALLSEIEFADSVHRQYGQCPQESRSAAIDGLIIVSAKHGQSPDATPPTSRASSRTVRSTASPASGSCRELPAVSPSRRKSRSDRPDRGRHFADLAVEFVPARRRMRWGPCIESQSPATSDIAGIGRSPLGIEPGPVLQPGRAHANGDPRSRISSSTPNIGVAYTGSSKKLAEHGGFAHDDVERDDAGVESRILDARR